MVHLIFGVKRKCSCYFTKIFHGRRLKSIWDFYQALKTKCIFYPLAKIKKNNFRIFTFGENCVGTAGTVAAGALKSTTTLFS